MNDKCKKGFTLIELLAVVALIAILVVMLVPKVLEYYDAGKKSAFISEAQKLYKTAFTMYTNNYIQSDTEKNVNCFIETDSKNKLLLTTGGEKYYKIKFNNDKIVYFAAYDKDYKVEIDNTSSNIEISIDEINVDDIQTDFSSISSCN